MMVKDLEIDPLFDRIRENATLIRAITTNVNLGEEAWSKRQLVSMILEIAEAADEIVKATGVSDLQAHYEDGWPLAIERLSEVREIWPPYSEG